MRRLCPDPDPVYPHRCRTCGRLCVAMAGYGGHWRHGARCMAFMPFAGERCYRLEGHAGGHRTRDAVEYANSLHYRYYPARTAAA